MQIVYTSPNRSHHYKYARSMGEAGVLKKFISGFSGLSPRAPLPEIGNLLHRADFYQNLYLMSLKGKMPAAISKELAYQSKLHLDRVSGKYLEGADIFMFYNGSGLSSCRKIKNSNTISIAEAVNSHLVFQEKLMLEEHNMLKLPYSKEHPREKERRIAEYEEADYILLPSNFVRNSFIELGFSAEKLIKVNYGFEKIKIEQKIEPISNNQDFVIVYVGSISVRKGLRYLIEAFSRFKHPHKKLVIVGPANKPSGIEDLSLPDGITFTGVLKGNDLSNAYRDASVFCLPSIEEGLALVLGEALSFGIPIIATENSGASDIITHGKEGFIVPIRDSAAIAESLQTLADDKYAYNQMKENAMLRADTLSNWDDTGKLLIEKLREIHNKK